MTRLRDDAVGKPGAHADGAAAREGSRRPRRSSANGGSISPSSARPPTICASASCIRARRSPTCRSRISATRRRNTTGPGSSRSSRAPLAANDVPQADIADALLKMLGGPDLSSRRWVWEQYDTLIQGNSLQLPGRRRRRGARRRPSDQGARLLLRRDAALLRGRPLRGRQAGGRRMLAQPDRRRRRAARRHRQPQFRQSRAARDHGPVRRRPSKASARPAARSASRSSRATSRSTTRPTAAASCRRRPSAASA